MFEYIFWGLILIGSLLLLIKSSDYFTLYAEKVGTYLGLPCLVVGIIILAIGTSLPELISSVLAVMKDSSEIVLGNVLGSNIANIFLILGFSAFFIKELKINTKCIKIDLILLLLITVFLLLASINGSISIYEGILFIIAIIFYILYATIYCKNDSIICDTTKDKKIHKNLILLLLSCGLVYIASEWTINSVIVISELIKIPKETIAITVIAVGTSLPELVVSLSALKKGNDDMAIGNIIGSCIFNSLAIVGVSALFGTLIVTGNILLIAFPVLFIALFFFTINTVLGRISQTHGAIYLIIYLMFITSLVFVK